MITAPPPPLPPENGVSAIRDVTLEPGVPDLTRGRRPVAPPLARMSGSHGHRRGDLLGQRRRGRPRSRARPGPTLLRPAAEQAVASWVFRRARADRAYLVAVFTYTGDKGSAVVRPQAGAAGGHRRRRPPHPPAAPPPGARRRRPEPAAWRRYSASAFGAGPLLRRGLLLLGLGLRFLLVRRLLRRPSRPCRPACTRSRRARGRPSPPRRPCGGRGGGCGCSRRAGSRSARRWCRRASSPPPGPGCGARRAAGRGGGRPRAWRG